MGTTIVMEVKDREKLAATLKTLINTLPATTGADIGLREHDYNGTAVYTLHVTQQGFPFAPTYAITKDGWLVIGFFPQSVHGFLYRNSGKKTAVWQEPALAQEALKKVGAQTDAKITAISVVDPRPGLAEILSLAPILVKTITSFSGAGGDFNIGLIPPAQPATERLTHNVTVIVDDGQTVRWEGYASLPLPLQFTGLDMYGYIAFFSFARLAF
jgi:hypothetical protein